MNVPTHLQITQHDDGRLLLKVTLVASGRPTYQPIYCMNCGKPMGSIERGEILAVTDVDDDSWDAGKPRLNLRCNGKFCRTWYRFVLN